ETTPTDPRAQRNRAGRRGGHLLTRALSPPNNTGLPTLLHSRRPCPGRSHRKPTTPRLTSEEADGTGGAVGLSYQLVQCRQEIRSAAMISQAPDGFARFIPVARGLTPRRPASRSVPPAGVAQERSASPEVGLPSPPNNPECSV